MKTEHPVNRRWSQRQRDWAVVFWIAFLSASAGAFILFGAALVVELLFWIKIYKNNNVRKSDSE